MQAKAADRDVKALLCESETTLNRSWLNLVVEPQLNTALYRQNYLLWCLVTCGGADEIWETEFASRRFWRFQYKGLSTNQNQGVTWLSQDGSGTTLGTRYARKMLTKDKYTLEFCVLVHEFVFNRFSYLNMRLHTRVTSIEITSVKNLTGFYFKSMAYRFLACPDLRG